MEHVITIRVDTELSRNQIELMALNWIKEHNFKIKDLNVVEAAFIDGKIRDQKRTVQDLIYFLEEIDERYDEDSCYAEVKWDLISDDGTSINGSGTTDDLTDILYDCLDRDDEENNFIYIKSLTTEKTPLRW